MTISNLLFHVKVPQKSRIEHEARVLSKKIFQPIFEGYKFQPRGSLFSPYVTHVSDMDIHLYGHERLPADPWKKILNVSLKFFFNFFFFFMFYLSQQCCGF